MVADSKTDFFHNKYSTRAQGCAFCGHLGHRIHACPAAEEYVNIGHVRIINHCLYLPTGQPIPNDGHSLRLKAGVDAWLAANQQYSNMPTASTMQHDAPPYVANMCFEISPEPEVPVSIGAYITETDVDLEMDSKDNYPSELYDMFEVFVTRKTDSAPSTISAPAVPLASAASTTTPFPLTHHMRTSQYRYQASAKDQALMKQAMDWFLKGKLDQMT